MNLIVLSKGCHFYDFVLYLYGWLLNELANSGVGYYMGGVFAGTTGNADDLKLLTSSANALKILATICEQYA